MKYLAFIVIIFLSLLGCSPHLFQKQKSKILLPEEVIGKYSIILTHFTNNGSPYDSSWDLCVKNDNTFVMDAGSDSEFRFPIKGEWIICGDTLIRKITYKPYGNFGFPEEDKELLIKNGLCSISGTKCWFKSIELMQLKYLPNNGKVAFKKTDEIIYYPKVDCMSPKCRDTLISAREVKQLSIENLGESISEGNSIEVLGLLKKLIFLEVLYLEGDDADSFKELKEEQFEIIVCSINLKKIYIGNVFETKQFKKYVRKKHKRIKIL